ncbi:MAG: multiprotein bridging factor aMBF1 [Candidatus Woesearchaeota archaeon]
MASCDMCGKDDRLIKVKLEGTIMNVCTSCSKYGEKINETNFKSKSYFKKMESEIEEVLVSNYSTLIKNSREKLNLKQEDVAKKINEKESLIHQIESGSITPRLVTIKKLEKFFNIKLIEKIENKAYEHNKENSNSELTIGDLLEKAMKKNKK